MISATNPKKKDPSKPTRKERLAYAIEWGIKIAYPLMFLCFNIAYWSYYLNK